MGRRSLRGVKEKHAAQQEFRRIYPRGLRVMFDYGTPKLKDLAGLKGAYHTGPGPSTKKYQILPISVHKVSVAYRLIVFHNYLTTTVYIRAALAFHVRWHRHTARLGVHLHTGTRLPVAKARPAMGYLGCMYLISKPSPSLSSRRRSAGEHDE